MSEQLTPWLTVQLSPEPGVSVSVFNASDGPQPVIDGREIAEMRWETTVDGRTDLYVRWADDGSWSVFANVRWSRSAGGFGFARPVRL